MKKLLIILAIVVATSVSAQDTKFKVSNLTVDTDAYGGNAVRISWNVQNAVLSQWSIKNSGVWPKHPTDGKMWDEHQINRNKNYFDDVTYIIEVHGKSEIKRNKVRVSKILAISSSNYKTTNNEVYLNLVVEGDWNNVVGRVVYIGKDNALGTIITSEAVGFGHWITVSLDEEHGDADLVEAVRAEDDPYAWFKQ